MKREVLVDDRKLTFINPVLEADQKKIFHYLCTTKLENIVGIYNTDNKFIGCFVYHKPGLVYEIEDNTINKFNLLKVICEYIFHDGINWKITMTSYKDNDEQIYKKLGFKYNEPPIELKNNQSKTYTISGDDFYKNFPGLVSKEIRLTAQARTRKRSSFSESDIDPINR